MNFIVRTNSLKPIRLVIFLCLLLFASLHGTAQSLGQDPSTAFPVCGTAKFQQQSVPLKPGRRIPAPCGQGLDLEDVNPYYYRFTAYTSGTLGLLITPVGTEEDYDWHIFDITGRDPSDIYSDISLLVAGNWSQYYGTTGTSTTAKSLMECGGDHPKWSKMPTIVQGHTYLLLISHFTNNQSGYTLEFKGGTASITDPLLPAVKDITANCDGSKLNVFFNKKLRCNSLAVNGSDFSLVLPGRSIIAAASVQCGYGFDMDSVQLTVNQPLNPGVYFLTVRNGTDGNTLLDYCDRPVDSLIQIPFTVEPLQPTPMDSLVTPSCGANYLELVFKKNIMCSSLTSVGSEFLVTGSSPVSIIGVTAICNVDGLTNRVRIKLTAPIGVGGSYMLKLQQGIDGNTILDECGMETTPGAVLPFVMKDTVSAAFQMNQLRGCKEDTYLFEHDGRHQVTQWRWTLPDGSVSTIAQPVYTTSSREAGAVQLIVSNGFCRDTSDVQIQAGEERVLAAFSGPGELCPRDGIQFVDMSTGPIVSWNWDFGNGSTTVQPLPPLQFYQQPARDLETFIRLVVADQYGCTDTADKKLLLVSSCIIVVPNAFTPNGDGRNDQLFPTNAYKADNLVFRIFNRYGQLVFETRDWTRKWDGRLNGRELEAGTYVWTLQYKHRDTGRQYALKGSTVLIR